MSINEEVALWSTTRQAAAIAAGEFGSRELLELLIDRIERHNGDLNAVVTLDLDTAREAADGADRMLADGQSAGPLHGVPITIKDALATAGIRSTGGATELHNHIPDQDAPVVQALKAAGAIVFGKTNLPRWSGDIQSYNDLFGTTVNPWNPERVPGGSSGGAAAAVAAGLTSFEIGTDIGGSIRFPSSFCGVFGHKPSWGVVPSTGYLDHESGGTTEADVNVLGPIARSAEDLELLLDLLLRREGPLVASLDPPPADVKSLKVACWLDARGGRSGSGSARQAGHRPGSGLRRGHVAGHRGYGPVHAGGESAGDRGRQCPGWCYPSGVAGYPPDPGIHPG
jgi:amidase